MAEALDGKWAQDGSVENFEEFMKALEVGIILRKVGNNTKSNEEWIIKGEDITLKITSTFKNKTLNFKYGVEFDEDTMDGRKVKSTFTAEDGKLVHRQVGKPHNTTNIREVQGDTLICTSTVHAPTEVTCVRRYKRSKE